MATFHRVLRSQTAAKTASLPPRMNIGDDVSAMWPLDADDVAYGFVPIPAEIDFLLSSLGNMNDYHVGSVESCDRTHVQPAPDKSFSPWLLDVAGETDSDGDNAPSESSHVSFSARLQLHEGENNNGITNVETSLQETAAQVT